MIFSNATVPPQDAGSDSRENTSWGVAMIFFGLLFLCTKRRIPRPEFRRGAAMRAAFLLREADKPQHRETHEREAACERSLLKQRVVDVVDGRIVLGEEGDKVTEPAQDAPPGVDEENACAICLDPFMLGDVVAWSRYDTCPHVFHDECLQEWLLNAMQQHDDCPSCRQTLLRYEDGDYDPLATSSSRYAFVIVDGLISTARRARASLLATWKPRYTQDGPPVPPSSPLRKVFSLGDKSAVRRRRSSHPLEYDGLMKSTIPLRRAVSVGSPQRQCAPVWMEDSGSSTDEDLLMPTTSKMAHGTTWSLTGKDAKPLPFRKSISWNLKEDVKPAVPLSILETHMSMEEEDITTEDDVEDDLLGVVDKLV